MSCASPEIASPRFREARNDSLRNPTNFKIGTLAKHQPHAKVPRKVTPRKLMGRARHDLRFMAQYPREMGLLLQAGLGCMWSLGHARYEAARSAMAVSLARAYQWAEARTSSKYA